MFGASGLDTPEQPVYVASMVATTGPSRVALKVSRIAAPLSTAQLSSPVGNGDRPLMIATIWATLAGSAIVKAWSRWCRLVLGSWPKTGVTVTTLAVDGIVPAAALADGQTARPIARPVAARAAVSANAMRRREIRAPVSKVVMTLGRVPCHPGSGRCRTVTDRELAAYWAGRSPGAAVAVPGGDRVQFAAPALPQGMARPPDGSGGGGHDGGEKAPGQGPDG